jgi:hypothetical protein
MRTTFSILVAAAMTVAGILTIYWGVNILLKAWRSSSWPHTTALIQESRLESHSSSGPHGGGTGYTPIVTYSYTVDGHSHLSSRIRGGSFWNLKSSRQVVAAYPAGSRRTVYYSPSDPDDSLLLTGVHSQSFEGIVLGTLIMSFGIFLGTIAYLAPKYGTVSPSGRSYSFDNDSPMAAFIWVGLIVIMCQFLLLWVLL